MPWIHTLLNKGACGQRFAVHNICIDRLSVIWCMSHALKPVSVSTREVLLIPALSDRLCVSVKGLWRSSPYSCARSTDQLCVLAGPSVIRRLEVEQ